MGRTQVKSHERPQGEALVEIEPRRDNPQEVAAARIKLDGEIMGEEATRKLKVRGLGSRDGKQRSIQQPQCSENTQLEVVQSKLERNGRRNSCRRQWTKAYIRQQWRMM